MRKRRVLTRSIQAAQATSTPIGPPIEPPVVYLHSYRRKQQQQQQQQQAPSEQPTEHPIEQPIEPPIEQPIEQPIEHPIEHPIEPPTEHPKVFINIKQQQQQQPPTEHPKVIIHLQQQQQAPPMNSPTEEVPSLPIKIIIPSSMKEETKPIITIHTSSLLPQPVSATIPSSTPSTQPVLSLQSSFLNSSPTPISSPVSLSSPISLSSPLSLSSPVSTSSQLNLPPLTPLPSPFPHKFELYQAIQNNTLNSYQYYRASLSPDDHRICLLQSPLTHGLINRTTPFFLL